MSARTISEKILSAKAGREVHAGEIAICNVDHVLGTDASSPMAIDYFEKMGGERLFDDGLDDLHGLALVKTVQGAGVVHLKFVRP